MSSSKILKKVKYGMRFIPDKMYLQIYYFTRFKKFINFKNPKTFNEKLNWLKIYDRNSLYTMLVDKYEVKDYVANLIGDEYIIPTLGVWNCFDEIDFEKLPNQFVLKCTHDSEGLIIVRDKSKLDIKKAKEKLESSMKNNFYYIGREWPYKNVKPRIIAEKYMQDGQNKSLKDYKFYCFNGEPKFLYVSEGLENHDTARIEFFDMNFKPAPFSRTDYKTFEVKPEKPHNFEKMKELAIKLSNNFLFLRVDFYEINNKIYFGELTFYPCGGMMTFSPDEWDKKIGDWLEISEKKKN